MLTIRYSEIFEESNQIHSIWKKSRAAEDIFRVRKAPEIVETSGVSLLYYGVIEITGVRQRNR